MHRFSIVRTIETQEQGGVPGEAHGRVDDHRMQMKSELIRWSTATTNLRRVECRPVDRDDALHSKRSVSDRSWAAGAGAHCTGDSLHGVAEVFLAPWALRHRAWTIRIGSISRLSTCGHQPDQRDWLIGSDSIHQR